MARLSAADLMDLWDLGSAQVPAERALTVLSVVAAERSMTVGERDAELLRVHVDAFGPMLSAVTDCPQCGAALDVDLDARELIVESVADGEADWPGVRHSFRLPTAGDLADVADADELFERCAGPDVPASQRGRIESLMAEADPGAEIELALTCPDCGHGWADVVDPTLFLWARIDAFVRDFAEEVHALASTYGWSEREILGLSPRRRQLYLEAVGR